MGNGILVFLLIVVISAIIGAVSQMMKNVQAAAPPPRRGRPNQSGDEIDKFLEEIDRLRKKKAGQEPPVARPVARPAARPSRPVSATTEDSAPTKRVRSSETAAFVPSRVTKLNERPAEQPATNPEPAGTDSLIRFDDLPVAPPVVIPPRYKAPSVPKTTRRVEATDFTRRLVAALGSPDGLPMAIAMQEILSPPKCKQPRRS